MDDPVRALLDEWKSEALRDHDGLQCTPYADNMAEAQASNRTLYRCIDELEAALAESGWRSMDSAPTDGTLVLCWRKGHGPFEAQWLVDGTEGDEDYFAGWVDPWADDEVVPTHWRPRIDLPGDAP